MPQCANRRATDVPYGKGSIPSELLEATFRTRKRAQKINEGEEQRCRVYTDMLEKHHKAQELRNAKVVARVQHSLKELEAYKDVLHSYRANKFMTLEWGYTPRKPNTPRTFRRSHLENRVYNCGFSMETLYPEVKQQLDRNKPEKKNKERLQKLINVSLKRSNFKIDRRMTDAAKVREHAFAVLRGTAIYPYDGKTRAGPGEKTWYRMTKIVENTPSFRNSPLNLTE